MTEGHRRHLAVSARYISQLLDEADRVSTLLPDARRQRIADAVSDVRREVVQFARRYGLDLHGPKIDALHAVRVQLSVASISVSEMRSRSMRGYGLLDDEAARDLDSACDALESAIQRVQHASDVA